ncbi:hypothetical protein ACIOJE_28840 [Kitasatospora sp. NPDC087861]|uniref:hypothetical protein n=1 Tax=Kitasatospora sp. NPDC087861 TaxID=3364070 RepID=UPI003828AAC7
MQAPFTLGCDDVFEFVNAYGGLYVLLGAQDREFTVDGTRQPTPGGRGMAFDRNPTCASTAAP